MKIYKKTMVKIKLKITMKCPSCAINIEKKLKKYVTKLKINAFHKIAKIEYDENIISKEEIIKKIKGIGYEVKEI